MTETYEFRVVEDFAHRLFAENEGLRLPSGIVRKVLLKANDPRLPLVGQLQREITATTGRALFYGWAITRRYTASELKRARLFTLFVRVIFEPAGEECGTMYDESTVCSVCGTGATQLSPLILDTGRIPKGNDLAATIAGEIVVSRRVADLCRSHEVTGINFGPVRSAGRTLLECPDWFQLIVSSNNAEIVPQTLIGSEPFDHDPAGECRCVKGDLAGLNLLSEVWIDGGTRGQADVFSTRQFIGTRRGLLRPRPLILVSPKARSLLIACNAKGWRADIAYLSGTQSG